MADPNYKRNRSGYWCIRVPLPRREGELLNHRWVCTRERLIDRARAVVAESGVDRLILLANAQALTLDAIQLVTQGRKMTGMAVIDAWRDWLTQRLAPLSVARYYGVAQTLARLHGLDAAGLGSIGEAEMDDFLNAGYLTLSARKVRLFAVLSLFRFAQGRGYVIANPTLLVKIDRRNMTVEQLEKKHYQPITEEEYRIFMARRAAAGPDIQWIYDGAVLGYCCGLRMVDVCHLQWASFTATEIIIYVRKHRSGGKRLVLPLDDPLIARPELQSLIADLLNRSHAKDEPFVWPEVADRKSVV